MYGMSHAIMVIQDVEEVMVCSHAHTCVVFSSLFCSTCMASDISLCCWALTSCPERKPLPEITGRGFFSDRDWDWYRTGCMAPDTWFSTGAIVIRCLSWHHRNWESFPVGGGGAPCEPWIVLDFIPQPDDFLSRWIVTLCSACETLLLTHCDR